MLDVKWKINSTFVGPAVVRHLKRRRRGLTALIEKLHEMSGGLIGLKSNVAAFSRTSGGISDGQQMPLLTPGWARMLPGIRG